MSEYVFQIDRQLLSDLSGIDCYELTQPKNFLRHGAKALYKNVQVISILNSIHETIDFFDVDTKKVRKHKKHYNEQFMNLILNKPIVDPSTHKTSNFYLIRFEIEKPTLCFTPPKDNIKRKRKSAEAAASQVQQHFENELEFENRVSESIEMEISPTTDAIVPNEVRSEIANSSPLQENFNQFFNEDISRRGAIKQYPIILIKVALLILIEAGIAAQKIKSVVSILDRNVHTLKCGVPSIRFFQSLRVMIRPLNDEHFNRIVNLVDSHCTVWFDESPSHHQDQLLVVGFSTVDRDYVIWLKPKAFHKDETLKGEKLADFIISLLAKIIDQYPNFVHLVRGILSDSSPSAKVTRKKFIENFKNKYPDSHPIKEIPCQAHSTALLETTILKQLDLVSLADKVSTCLGNVASKGSLRERWDEFVKRTQIKADKFVYRRGIRWGADFENLDIINKNKGHFKEFLEQNSAISKKSGKVILDMIKNDPCLMDKLELVGCFKYLTNQIWKVLGKNQTLKVLHNVMRNLKELSTALASLDTEECLDEKKAIDKILDLSFKAFKAKRENIDQNCIKKIHEDPDFRELFFVSLSKITQKLLVYEIKTPETDSEETINIVTTNVIAERCFSIVKHWENRFCQVGIMQTCEIAKANINGCSEFIQNLSCSEIEQFHKRRVSKATRQSELDEQAEYEKIVQSNRAKVVSELTQRDETVTAMALLIHREPSYIPSSYPGK